MANILITVYFVLLVIMTGGLILVGAGINATHEGPWFVGYRDSRSVWKTLWRSGSLPFFPRLDKEQKKSDS